MTDVWIPLGKRPDSAEAADRHPFRGPDWMQADPARIQRSLERALALPSGGWFAVDASRAIGTRPTAYQIAGHELVLWRNADGLCAAPEACPHMGASLAGACLHNDRLVCPWHGLELGRRGHGQWRHYPTWDDGVLSWVRLDGTVNGSDPPTAEPILAGRPGAYIDGVIRVEAACDPQDILANRLDPWHGAHFHPYSFGRLTVTDATDDVLSVRVAFRLVRRLVIEVDCTFHCPEPRTIVMTITGGEGVGSVVETHATPIAPGRSVILEATLATSERGGFAVARRLRRAIRPAIRWVARRLWVDDAAYAERRYALRQRGALPTGDNGCRS